MKALAIALAATAVSLSAHASSDASKDGYTASKESGRTYSWYSHDHKKPRHHRHHHFVVDKPTKCPPISNS
ncbi:hypothetical protein [Hydrogenophaga sp. 5NK40-0174]|uniref:hypothetical protein n=1 Tax=Hydrogenophaga sp. 5NK40-0174 TaxID=3127649 RepID=UPI003107CD44